MPKQEEIREGLSDRIYGLSHQPPDVDGILQYLHSQGVVIKVDRDLPEMPSDYDYEDNNYLYGQAQDDMEEAGYAAIEPLIDEQ